MGFMFGSIEFHFSIYGIHVKIYVSRFLIYGVSRFKYIDFMFKYMCAMCLYMDVRCLNILSSCLCIWLFMYIYIWFWGVFNTWFSCFKYMSFSCACFYFIFKTWHVMCFFENIYGLSCVNICHFRFVNMWISCVFHIWFPVI